MNGLTLTNGAPAWVAAVALTALASLAAGWAASRHHPPRRRALLALLRAAGLLVMAAAVLRPAMRRDVVRHQRVPLAVLLDTSRSMHVGRPAPAAWTTQRLSELEGALDDLAPYYALSYRTIASPSTESTLDELTAAASNPAETTPLFAALNELSRRMPDLAGIVLLSDGQDTGPESPETPVVPVPVYPLVPDDADTLPDLAIVSLDVPPVAFIRTPVRLRVGLHRRNTPREPLRINLLEGSRLLSSVTLPAGPAGPVETAVEFTPTRTGRKTFTVEAGPVTGETITANNRRRFSISVIRDKTRVLLVAGTPTWDVKFLRRTLRQDPGVDLITFLILRTPRDLNLVPQSEMSLIPFPTRELFSEELPSFDAVIFADFDYAPYVPLQYLKNIVRFVREDGGGFIMTGGDRSYAAGGYMGSPVADILPVEIGGASRHQTYLDRPFRPRLTDTGLVHPIFQWRADPGANRLLWNGLPKLEGMNWILRARADAAVLADNPGARNEHGAPPVIALAEVGSGRTAAIATDGLWRWGLPHAGATGEATVYRDFWRRMLRWIIHDPDMALVRLATPPPGLRAGHEVRFAARVLDRRYRPAHGARLSGAVTSHDGRRTLPLTWEEQEPGQYVSRPVTPPAEGTWIVDVEARDRATALGSERIQIPVLAESPEYERVGVNRAVLETLAETSGGALYEGSQSGLIEKLRESGETRTEVVGRKVTEVWPVAPLLLLALLLLAFDWGLRRLWHG